MTVPDEFSHNWKFIVPEESPVRVKFSDQVAARLMATARSAKNSAYAPYSKFQVGAAVLMTGQDGEPGEIHSGCNVENASYGATMCAERSAVFSAITAGGRKIVALALTLDSVAEKDLSQRSPCGLCRQVISEFADSSTAIVIDSGRRDGIEFTGEVMGIAELLPWGFRFEDPQSG